MIVYVTGFKFGDFVYILGDVYVYVNYIELLKIQFQRKFRFFLKFLIKREVKDIDDFKFEDFEIVGYNFYLKIVMEMVVQIC